MRKKFGHSVWLLCGGRKRLELNLRRAAANEHEALIIMALIDMGANVDARDPATGRTALMLAVEYDCRSNIVALLTHGADVHIQAKNGKSALEMARAKGLDEIAELLKDTHRANQSYVDR